MGIYPQFISDRLLAYNPITTFGYQIMSNQQHSRLGQILINKGLITSKQLDAAITLQLTSQKRLGEILVEQGWVTEQQLHKALRKQTNLRLAATLVAALLSPFQMASADIGRLQPPTTITANLERGGMQAMSDSELGSISAQGLDETLQQLFLNARDGDGLGTLEGLAKLVMPVLDSLESEYSVRDVVYDTGRMTSSINADGSISVRLPSSIGEMHFDNIRVAGAPASQSFGSISLHDIDLSGSSLTIRVHP